MLGGVCACGCFVPVAILAAIVYCLMHGMWIAAGVLVATLVAIGWFGRKMLAWRPGRKRTPPGDAGK